MLPVLQGDVRQACFYLACMVVVIKWFNHLLGCMGRGQGRDGKEMWALEITRNQYLCPMGNFFPVPDTSRVMESKRCLCLLPFCHSMFQCQMSISLGQVISFLGISPTDMSKNICTRIFLAPVFVTEKNDII